MKIIQAFFLTLTFLNCGWSFAQDIQKIKFAKNSSLVYFFQKGLKSDTVVKNRSDLFYFLLSDSMETEVLISVENGRLIKTGNDSLLVLEHLPGLKYETYYANSELPPSSIRDKNKSIKKELNSRINGSTDKRADVILIKVWSKKEEHTLIENTFYYKK